MMAIFGALELLFSEYLYVLNSRIVFPTLAVATLFAFIVLKRPSKHNLAPRTSSSLHSLSLSSLSRAELGATTMNDERILVEEARRLLVSSGDAQKDVVQAMHALAALVSAVRIKDGDAAASALLERGRALFQEREGTDAERDAAMFSLGEDTSLLKERGAEDILCDAFADGSSVLCRRCQGLVSRARWNAHKTKWCTAVVNQYVFAEDNFLGEEEDGDDMKMELE